jgi:tryptophanyl-tRNA synthetase
MSKSDLSDMSRINMTDTPELIAQKIRKAKTDPAPLPSNPEELEGRPEADNLLTLYAALSDTTKRAAIARFAGTQFSLLKAELTEAAVETLGPIAARMNALMADTAALDAILRDGADKANAIAQPILAEAKQLVGFLPR